MARTDGIRHFHTALGGVMAAGSLALLWLACVAPSGRIGLTAAAGLFPMAAVLRRGRAAGGLCWAAASLLGLLLLPDKGVALLFLTFLGPYPVVKGWLETLERRSVEWGLKLCWFNLTLTLFWFALQELFLPRAPDWLRGSAVLLYSLGSLIFVAYDIGLSRLITLLRARFSGAKGH